MKVNRGRVADAPSDQRGPTFTGKVWADPLLQGVPGVLVNAVFFPPGVPFGPVTRQGRFSW